MNNFVPVKSQGKASNTQARIPLFQGTPQQDQVVSNPLAEITIMSQTAYSRDTSVWMDSHGAHAKAAMMNTNFTQVINICAKNVVN